METFKASGLFTKQAHVKVPEGHYEEEHGRKGFFGRVSHLYHTHMPTGWSQIDGDLLPRNLPPVFDKSELSNTFVPFLENDDVKLSLGRIERTFPHFFRNADHDEMFFAHEGEGRFETVYGHVPFKKGDYVILPRGTTYKLFIDAPARFLKVASNSEFEQPTRGIMGPNALYDQTAIFVPEAAPGSEQNLAEYTVEVQRLGKITRVTYPFNPLDAAGWKGSLYPWRLSIYDYCPVTSHRYHMPPSAHTTFVAKDFVVCSFVARPLESAAEGVLKVPFFHANIDYDEVLFYHAGDFFSRDNIAAGALTFHPQGVHHGPHPKAFQKSSGREFTDEYAVMVDARKPLRPTEAWSKMENKDYWKSWMTPKETK
jgi:homogentisate 1,2-dioxygenase